MYLSVVTTLFYSSAYMQEFYQRVGAAAQKITSEYEIIFVNDGSPDDSLEIAISFYKQDRRRIKVLDLSRNFGHHKAIMTGLAHATGDFVFLIDVDLEEEPELLNLFYEEINKSQSDVVYGVQKKRRGNWFERASGQIYYWLFNILSGYTETPRNVLTARLMVQDYVKALIAHKEREFDIMGLWSLTGFRQSALAVNKHSKGTTVYSLRRKISLFLNTITAFSSRPLFLIFFLGLIISALSLGYSLSLAIRGIFLKHQIEGWMIVAASIWVVGGLTIFCLGTIGIYIAKMFIETKQRPYTIIRKSYGIEDRSDKRI